MAKLKALRRPKARLEDLPPPAAVIPALEPSAVKALARWIADAQASSREALSLRGELQELLGMLNDDERSLKSMTERAEKAVRHLEYQLITIRAHRRTAQRLLQEIRLAEREAR